MRFTSSHQSRNRTFSFISSLLFGCCKFSIWNLHIFRSFFFVHISISVLRHIYLYCSSIRSNEYIKLKVIQIIISFQSLDLDEAAAEDPCLLDRQIGFCRAAIKRFYFDKSSNDCKRFTYGGKNTRSSLWILTKCKLLIGLFWMN